MIKKILFILLFLFIYVPSYSAVFIVSNQPEAERDYSSIQSAIEHASSYDTIYVKGSPMNYGNVLLEKPLVLIGEGFSEDIQYLEDIQTGHTAKLTRILFTSNPYRRTISSGSVIKGFEFPYFPGQRPNIITVANESVVIEDITIERNWLWFVHIVGSAENWTIRNNIIRGWINGGVKATSDAGASGFLIQNNIVNSIMGFKRGDVTIEHNIIMGRLKNISNATVTHNIFTRDEFILEQVYGSRFQNNLASGTKIGHEECYDKSEQFEAKYLCAGEANTGVGNRIGVDPGFLIWPANDIMGGTVFKLDEGSPARNPAFASGEAGIFGGKHPFPSNSFLNPEIDDPFPSFVTSIY